MKDRISVRINENFVKKMDRIIYERKAKNVSEIVRTALNNFFLEGDLKANAPAPVDPIHSGRVANDGKITGME